MSIDPAAAVVILVAVLGWLCVTMFNLNGTLREIKAWMVGHKEQEQERHTTNLERFATIQKELRDLKERL